MDSRFLIFSASAGSGKTFNLAVQYIALLVARSKREFAATLAVTFTNKATGEMKDRILEQLYGIGYGLPESAQYMDALQRELRESYRMTLSTEAVQQACRDALQEILHDYSRFYVSTIDSFFQNVLRNMAHELGLTARLQVDISDRSVTEMAVEHLIDALRYDDKELLPWLNDYVATQLTESKSWDIRGGMNRIADNLFKEVYLRRPLDPRNKPLNVQTLGELKQQLSRERERLGKQLSASAEAFEQVMMDNGLDYSDLSHGKDWVFSYVSKIKCGDYEAKFSASLEKRVSDPLEFISAKERKTATAGFVAVLQQLSAALDAMHQAQESIARPLAPIQLVQRNLHPLGVLSAIDNEVKRENADANRFSLAHTPILLRQMIEDSDAPFVFEKSGTRYHNVMIDEFQDTSTLQWDNFSVLLMNNLAQGGMSMVVGDVKQSIYRWRNGDWRILYGLSQGGIRGFETVTKSLQTNYRSLGNIINFNNRFFPRAAAWLDKLCPDASICLADMYSDVAQEMNPEKQGKGYVRIHIHNGELTAQEWQEQTMQEMGEQIKRLHDEHHVPYRKMAILIRVKRSIAQMVSYFAGHFPELKLVSNEAFRLNYSVAVNMLVNALRVLHEQSQASPNPVPLLYLAQHYRRDILGQGMADDAYTDVSYLLCEPQDTLPKDFTEQQSVLCKMPLHQLCEQLYRTFRLQRIAGQDAYLLSFFDELAVYLSNNPSDIGSFLDYWDSNMQFKTIPSGAVDGINVLTIHSSKGLQYHSVFIPFMDDCFEADKKNETLWCMPPNPPANYLGSLPVSQTTGMENTDFAAAYRQEHDARRADALNVIYVAFTRAESNLMVWGSVTQGEEVKPPKETSGDLIAGALEMEEDIWEAGEPMDYVAEKKNDSSGSANRLKPATQTEAATMASYEGNTEFRQSRPAAQFVRMQSDAEEMSAEETKQLSYIEKGKLLHYIFSQIKTEEDLPTVLREMHGQGVLRTEAQMHEVESLARRGLDTPAVKAWFSPDRQHFNECNVLARQADGSTKVLRPDRVIMDEERVVVVDFKFGKPNEEYHRQVKEYMDYMQQMYPTKSVEGYLWYVYSNKVERV